MESHRKSLINKCNDRINELRICIKNDDDMIIGIKNLGDTAYVRAQISKYDTKKAERILEIDELGIKIEKIPSGEFDCEIKSTIQNNLKDQEDKKRIRDEKLKEEKQHKLEKSKISNAFYQNTRVSDREKRYEDKDFNKNYGYFIKTSNSIPDYILNNLKTMPNNKGYIWRNIACYGELPKERGQPITLFDRQRGGLLIIHEWTPNEYNVYHKKDKDRKILYSSELRKKLKGSILF